MPPLEFCQGVAQARMPRRAAFGLSNSRSGSGTLAAVADSRSASQCFADLIEQAADRILSRAPLAISSSTAPLDSTGRALSRCRAMQATAATASTRGSAASTFASASSSSTRPMPLAATIPSSARPGRAGPLTAVVRCLTSTFAGLVQHQNRLLVGTLDRYEAHIRSRHRLADRRRIDHVILAPLDVGFDVSRRYQNHLVPHRGQFAAPNNAPNRTPPCQPGRARSRRIPTSCIFERFTLREIDRPPSLSSP